MFAQSLIRRTGQGWKLLVGWLTSALGLVLLALIVGGVLRTNTPAATLGLLVLGVLVGAGGLTWTAVSVRCVACGERLVWRTIRTYGWADWLPQLLAIRDCPRCGGTS